MWGIVLAAWTLLAAAFAVGSSLAYMMSYNPPRWGLSLLRSLTEWYAWAALTPLIVWLARRFTLSRDHRLRNALVLAALGVPVAMLKIVGSQILRSLAGFTGYALPGNVVAQVLDLLGRRHDRARCGVLRRRSRNGSCARRAPRHVWRRHGCSCSRCSSTRTSCSTR